MSFENWESDYQKIWTLEGTLKILRNRIQRAYVSFLRLHSFEWWNPYYIPIQRLGNRIFNKMANVSLHVQICTRSFTTVLFMVIKKQHKYPLSINRELKTCLMVDAHKEILCSHYKTNVDLHLLTWEAINLNLLRTYECIYERMFTMIISEVRFWKILTFLFILSCIVGILLTDNVSFFQIRNRVVKRHPFLGRGSCEQFQRFTGWWEWISPHRLVYSCFPLSNRQAWPSIQPRMKGILESMMSWISKRKFLVQRVH